MAEPIWTPDEQTPPVYARLSGDYNPVHLDPDVARAAGFRTVIVHGMCVLGAASRAAQCFAPEGTVLRGLDVRFSNPVLPGQTVVFAGDVKEQADGVRVQLTATLDTEDRPRIMNPASFTFGAPGGPWPLPRGVETAPEEKDVLGDPYSFDDATLSDYGAITAPSPRAEGEGIPPTTALLGMTGALEKAFRGVEPEKPGTWVHLRQTAVFQRAVQAGELYLCRIQGGRTLVRNADVGAHVTIPFVVEGSADGALLATGSCVLLYAFDREDS